MSKNIGNPPPPDPPRPSPGRPRTRLCDELALLLLGGSRRGGGGGTRGTGHLDGDDAAEGAGLVVVGDLDQADVLLPPDGAGAGGVGGDGELDGEVHVDVGGALGDDARVLEDGAHEGLLGDGAGALAVVAGQVLGGGEHGARGEGALARGVDDGLDGPAAVGGDDVEDARDLGVDLGEGAAGLGHGALHHGRVDLALASGLAEAVGLDVGLAEDGGVDLGLLFSISC